MPELEPLDPEIASLLSAAKPLGEIDEPRRAAILGRVEARLGSSGGGEPPDGGAGKATGGASGGTASGALRGLRGAATLAGTLTLGIAIGVLTDRAILSRTSNVAPAPLATAVAPTPPPSARAAGEAPPVAASAPLAAASTASRPAPATLEAPLPSPNGLAAERALLDVARASLARGEPAEALSAVARHAAAYPSGALVEEREALAIKALVALGRRDEARARLLEFERRFPRSLMLHAVKSAVGEAP